MSAPTAAAPVPPILVPDPVRWRALGALLLAMFMVLLDTSIVTNGLATIQRDLGASATQVQFVLTGYAVSYGALLITGGRLGDRVGRRRMFLAGLAAFTLTSALCGLAWSANSLIAFRVLQGLSAALLFPQVASFIQVLFGVPERPRAFGFQGAVIGLGVIAGPLLGGVLIDADLWGTLWRPIFLVNVPVGLAALVWARRVLPESSAPAAGALDLPSVALLSAGLGLLIYPLVEGRDWGWPAWIWALLGAGVSLLGAFVWQQARLAALGRRPLVLLALFRERAFRVGALISFVFQSSVLSYFVAMSLFFQAGLGYGPTRAALTLITYQIAIAGASLASARLTARLGRSLLSVGTALLIAGLSVTLLMLRASALHYRGYELVPALVVCGLGFGCLAGPLQAVILARVQPEAAGSASGILATVQQVGSALGVAVVGALLFGTLAGRVDAVAERSLPALRASLGASGLPDGAVPAVVAGFQACSHDRLSQRDLSATPPSCAPRGPALPPAARQALESAGTAVRRETFLDALLVALRFQLAAYVVCSLLVLLLPAQAGASRPRAAGAPA